MKYLKKKKKPVRLWLLLALTALLAVLILVAFLRPGDEPAPDGETTDPAAQSEAIQPDGETDPDDPTAEKGESQTPAATETPDSAEPSADDVKIETPYGVLYYPGDWSGLLQVDQISGDPHQVVFTAALDSGIIQELFTISFGGDTIDAVGVVKVSGKEVPVHLSIQPIEPGDDWTANEISVIYSMQECLNDVLAGLNLTTPQQEPENSQTTLPPQDDETMTIDTPAGELRYPSRWKDYLKLETRQEDDVYTLEFYADLEGFEPVPLFNVCLGGNEGIYVMDITAPDGSAVKLCVDIFEIEADINWTDAQKAIVLAMQEDINVLLSELN